MFFDRGRQGLIGRRSIDRPVVTRSVRRGSSHRRIDVVGRGVDIVGRGIDVVGRVHGGSRCRGIPQNFIDLIWAQRARRTPRSMACVREHDQAHAPRQRFHARSQPHHGACPRLHGTSTANSQHYQENSRQQQCDTHDRLQNRKANIEGRDHVGRVRPRRPTCRHTKPPRIAIHARARGSLPVGHRTRIARLSPIPQLASRWLR